MRLKIFFILQLFVIVFITSCFHSNINKSSYIYNSSKDMSIQEFKKIRNEQLINTFKGKNIYSGKIDLSINTLLMKSNKIKNNFKINSFQENEINLKSLPKENIVYYKSLIVDNRIKLFEDFSISNVLKRYTLYIKTDKIAQGSIAINTIRWITQDDFNKSKEIIKNSILLNRNNRIYIDLKGKNIKLEIFLIKNLESELMNKRKKSFLNHDSNSKHVNAGDINIFDGTIESLGGLEPYEGDINLDIGNSRLVSSLLVNNKDEVRFEPGVLIVKFKTNEGLELFKNLYNAEIIDEVDSYYKLKLSLNINIGNIEVLLREYNQKTAESIKSIEFSSINSMKTFFIAMDFIVNHSDKIDSIEANIFPQLPSTPIYFNDWSYISSNEQKNWALEKCNLFEAWSYSIGTDVLAAIVDDGFNKEHPEIKRRIKLNKENNQRGNGIFDRNNLTVTKNNSIETHGHNAILVAFGERNNNIKSVGVSPNSDVIPYVYASSLDIALSIKKSVEYNSKMIILNLGIRYDNWSSFSNSFQEGIITFFTGSSNIVDRVGDTVINKKIPVIIAAHNYGEHVLNWVPAFMDYLPGAIVVSGAKFKNNNIKAYFDKNFGYDNGKGTNFGDYTVWGPWVGLYVSDYSNYSTLVEYTGTSSSTPFV